MARSKKSSTTITVVWADIGKKDLRDLKRKVKLVQTNPDYTLVTNYEVHWEEIEIDSKKRIVWADISPKELGKLTKLVERAMSDPDFTIVVNYEVHRR